MHLSRRLFIGTALIAVSSITTPTLAKDMRSVVVDSQGNYVRSILSGACVRTKWEMGNDQCAPKQYVQPAPTPAYIAPQRPPAPRERVLTRAHDRSYMVFYDFNKHHLTPEAKGVIAGLVESVTSAKKVLFNLVGHADRSGPDAYNTRLSQKRSIAVRDELIRLGAHPDHITTSWRGESDPLVPTADGIKEPQNRRTEINIRTEVEERVRY